MKREEADAERERLQREDRDHTYFVREQSAGEWEVVRTNLRRHTSDVVAEQGKPTDVREDFRPSSIRQVPPIGPGF